MARRLLLACTHACVNKPVVSSGKKGTRFAVTSRDKLNSIMTCHKNHQHTNIPRKFGSSLRVLQRAILLSTRTGSTGSHSSAAAPPALPSPTNLASHQDGNRHTSGNGYSHRRRRGTAGEEAEDGGGRPGRMRHDPDPGGRWTGPTRESTFARNGTDDDNYEDYDPAIKYDHHAENGGAKGGAGNRPGAAEDALSHEVGQRPHVRGSISEEHDGHHRQLCSSGGAESDDGTGRRGGGAGAVSKRPGRCTGGGGRDEADDDLPPEGPGKRDSGGTRPEGADFLESLRGGEGGGAGAYRRGGNSGPVSSSSIGKQRDRVRHARRPEWNSDTAAVASLGGAQSTILTDNSPAALQVCVFMRG